jgi:hypothetical protein
MRLGATGLRHDGEMSKDETFEKPQGSRVARGERGGLYDGFEGYRTPTDGDNEVLTQGIDDQPMRLISEDAIDS